MAGSSTYGKGDTTRPGLRGDMKGGGYATLQRTQSAPGKTRNLAGYTSIAPAPQAAGGKVAVEKPTGTIGFKWRYDAPIGPTKPRVAAKKPPVAVKKPPTKKPAAQVISNVTRERVSPTKALPSNKPPATRFGTVTGKVTGTRVSGGAGYGGGGTRGSGSLSGGGSGSRSAGTSRTGGTQRNDPVRG